MKLILHFGLLSCDTLLSYQSTLTYQLEAAYTTKMLVSNNNVTHCHNHHDYNLNTHKNQKLRSFKKLFLVN